MKSVSYDKINKSREYLKPLGQIDCRALFGGYSLAVDNTVFAMVCDGELYLRANEACAEYSTGKPPVLLSVPKRGRTVLLNYVLVEEPLWQEPATLLHLSTEALRAAQREKRARESAKRLKDLPNITFQLEVQLCAANIRDVETLQAYGPRKAWLHIRKVNKHAGLRALMALAGAVEGLHAAALPSQTRNELYEWYHRMARRTEPYSGD
ncbi:TfoX/Sxy family DNA transformation protein [Enterobacteriaceae bacterium]